MHQIIMCPSCGAQNAAGQQFCGVCGTSLVGGMQQAITCPNCGAQNAVGQQFCGGCGTRLAVGGMQQAVTCPYCGYQNAAGQQFCGSCGTRLSAGCPYCGSAIDPRSRFCPSCGATIMGAETPPQARGMPYQAGWGQQQAWSQPAARKQPQPTSPVLILALVFLVLALGFFSYWAFASPSWLPSLFDTSPVTDTLDTTSPVLSKISATASVASAVINWTTNELASTQVEYGETDTYGSIEPSTPQDDPTTSTSVGVITHSVTLTGLTPETTYHYSIKSKDAAGNLATSTDKTFTTSAIEE